MVDMMSGFKQQSMLLSPDEVKGISYTHISSLLTIIADVTDALAQQSRTSEELGSKQYRSQKSHQGVSTLTAKWLLNLVVFEDNKKSIAVKKQLAEWSPAQYLNWNPASRFPAGHDHELIRVVIPDQGKSSRSCKIDLKRAIVTMHDRNDNCEGEHVVRVATDADHPRLFELMFQRWDLLTYEPVFYPEDRKQSKDFRLKIKHILFLLLYGAYNKVIVAERKLPEGTGVSIRF